MREVQVEKCLQALHHLAATCTFFNSFPQVCLRLPPTGECFGMPKCMFIDLRIHTNVLNDYAHRMPAKHYAYMYIRTYAHTHIRTYIT